MFCGCGAARCCGTKSRRFLRNSSSSRCRRGITEQPACADIHVSRAQPTPNERLSLACILGSEVMDRLYVIYGLHCGLCSSAKRWLMRQPTLIELNFVPSGSAPCSAALSWPEPRRAPPEELIVVSDQGAVYRDDSAWIMRLFTLEAYRTGPTGWHIRSCDRSLREAFALLSKERSRVLAWLSLASEVEIAETLGHVRMPPRVSGRTAPTGRSPRRRHPGERPRGGSIVNGWNDRRRTKRMLSKPTRSARRIAYVNYLGPFLWIITRFHGSFQKTLRPSAEQRRRFGGFRPGGTTPGRAI